MPNTARGISYPSPSDSVDIAGDMQILAETTETALSTFNYNMTAAGDILTRSASATAPQPVGANGAILIADSTTTTGLAYSISAKGYPAMVPIATTLLSGASTTISDIPQTYDDLLVRLKLRATGGTELALTWSGATAASYYRCGFTQRSNAAMSSNGYGGVGLASVTTLTNNAAVGSATNNYGYTIWEFLVIDYSSTVYPKNWLGTYAGQDGNNPNSGGIGGGNQGTAAITSITLAATASTFAAGSTAELYGFKK
jgi:hypothetical protein